MKTTNLAGITRCSLLVLATLVTGASSAAEDDAFVPSEEVEFDEVEALKRKASLEGDWTLQQDEQIHVEEGILRKNWAKPPFNTEVFDYTHEQIKRNWSVLLRSLGIEFPSPEYLRKRAENIPAYRASLDRPGVPFDGDYERLSRDVVEAWRLCLKGDYQKARWQGERLGFPGVFPAFFSQILYATYLEKRLDHKHMLLQDVANQYITYSKVADALRKAGSEYTMDYVVFRMGYVYALGRIAEDSPMRVVLARNYVFKIKNAINDMEELAPKHPLVLAMLGTLDANIMRRVGKAAGLATFGTKHSSVQKYFEQAVATLPDVAIVRTEYANSLIYMNKKRNIDQALEQLVAAAAIRPTYAWEALDAMYAAKRKKELDSLAAYNRTFRRYERKRLAYQKSSNQNLYCVIPKECPPYLPKD